MAPRFNRARLITEDDRHYRQFLEQIMLARQNQRAMRPPRERDLFGGEAEKALRLWLAQHRELSERRILEYEERRGHSWSRKYRELDAVTIEGRFIHVFEIKASRTAKALLRAQEQLDETRQILSLLFPRVATTILFVDTGIPTAKEVAAIMAEPQAPEKPPMTLDNVLLAQPSLHLATSMADLSEEPGVINLLLFTIQDIIDMVGAEHLHLNWDADEEVQQELIEGQHREDTSVQAPAEPVQEEEESPFAIALRKAMERRQKE
ncbi:MAG: hypothetical protein KatS3mg057_0567 [Herpetosiphonaceae bacterium]|nr:MAG: hypothetical protein KatS3mg057_0567 [Herpetosiphonaceae bacterium]